MSDQIDGNLMRDHLIGCLKFLHDIKRSLCASHASKYDTINVNNGYVEKQKTNLEAFFILTKGAII